MEQCRQFEALLAWKEDFFEPLKEDVWAHFLQLQNWAQTVAGDDGGEADTDNS